MSGGEYSGGLVSAAKARQWLPDLQVVYATGSPESLAGHQVAAWELVLLNPLQMRRQRAAVAAVFGGRFALLCRGIIAIRRQRRRCRAEGQRELVRVHTLGALPKAGPPQVVDDLLQGGDARPSRPLRPRRA